jgi:hypothetical protein
MRSYDLWWLVALWLTLIAMVFFTGDGIGNDKVQVSTGDVCITIAPRCAIAPAAQVKGVWL